VRTNAFLAALLVLTGLGGCAEDEATEALDGGITDAVEMGGDATPGDLAADVSVREDADAGVLDGATTADTADAADAADTGVDAPTLAAPQGALGPAGRVVSADVPSTATASRRAGCEVYGSSAGTSIANIVLLTGGLSPYFRRKPNGEIDFVLLVWAKGWEAGQRVSDLDNVDLAFLDGEVVPDSDRFLALRDNFPEGTDAPPRSYFRETIIEDGGWFETPASFFSLSVPLLNDYVMRMPFRTAEVRGRLFVDGPGLGIEDGVITGYVARDDMITVAEGLRDACYGESPPSICNLIGGQIGPDMTGEELIGLVVGFTPGFDVFVEGGAAPRPCDAEVEACNAMSMCVLFRAEGVTVDGVAQ
jgi:hypothetical protein